VYAETAAYLDVESAEVWCVKCGGDLNGLEPLTLAVLQDDARHNCTCCHKNLKSQFWNLRRVRV
jgi:hypothetical protein